MQAGIVGDRVIEPIFFDGANCLEFFQKELIPNVTILFFDSE